MQPPELILTDAPGEQAETVIDAGLVEYNRSQAGYTDARPLAVLVRDPQSGDTLGGLLGRTTLGLLFVDLSICPRICAGTGWARGYSRWPSRRPGGAAARRPRSSRSTSKPLGSTPGTAGARSGGSSATRLGTRESA
jgi:hypothetical protein